MSLISGQNFFQAARFKFVFVFSVFRRFVPESVFGNPGLEFRLQAAWRGNRLKAELRTPNDNLPAIFQTGSECSTARWLLQRSREEVTKYVKLL
jgi:hypothetical protein